MVLDLASFPNSRVKPRNATTLADTNEVYVNGNGEAPATILPDGGVVTANGNTLIIAANPNQTYIFVRNTDPASRLRYSYTDRADMLTKGNILEFGEGIDLEAKDGVWCRSETAGIPGRLKVTLDFGQG